MASNIVLKTYAAGDNNQGSVTPQNDALIYQCAVPMNGLFSGGTVTLSSANVLHVAAGFGIIGGRFFEILESDIAVQLSTSGTLLGRLYVHLSLTNADEPISIETATGATLPALSGDPTLNITNGDFDMELCTFNINELTISDILLTYPTITAANNQIRRATAYSVNDVALCQSASDSLIFLCTTAGTTAVSEPTGYATITDGNTITDGTAVFKAVSVSGTLDKIAGKADQSLLAPVLSTLVAPSGGLASGDQFVYNGLLYKATAAIAQGGAITIDGNCELSESVTEQISELIDGLKVINGSVIMTDEGSSNLLIRQSGHVVSIWGFINGLSLVANTTQTVGRISGVLLPSTSVRIRGSAGSNAYSVGSDAYVAVTDTGAISVQSSVNASTVYFNLTYIR